MSPLHTLLDAGLHLHTDGERLIVAPASLLTEPLRDLIRAHKPELWAAAREAEVTFANLVDAINRCCDLRGDDDRNRDGLIAEAGDYAVDAQRDLIEHFANETAIWSQATGQSSQPAAPAAQPHRRRAASTLEKKA